jgi:hypothetical protein
MEGLTEGRIVHYVMPNGEHRPAIVVRVWRQTVQVDPSIDIRLTQEFKLVPPENGCCQLQVFLDSDGEHDWNDGPKNILWATSVLYSEKPEPLTWHWIEKA